MAYSPRTGLFYIPGNHVCMNYEPVSGGEYVAGQPYVNAVLSMFPAGKVFGDLGVLRLRRMHLGAPPIAMR